MSKVQLPGSVRFDSQIKMHTGTENKDISLAKEFKNRLEGEHRPNGATTSINNINRLLCEVLVEASCLLLSDKKE